ncbi:MAG: beta-ketoacyl synthase N-terminal-like domain-containing protein [Acidimicrobiales bacterium]
MPPPPVAVTGVGTVSAAGVGHEQLWTSLVARDDGATPGPMTDFDPSPWYRPNEARRTDPYLQYAVAAAALALDDAGAPAVPPDRTGVVMGNVYGAAVSLEAQRDVLAARGPKAVSPLLAAQASRTPARRRSACASASAARRASPVPAAPAGPSPSVTGPRSSPAAPATSCWPVPPSGPITPVLRASYEVLRVLTRGDRARPFDRRRDGFVIADGACVLVLESAAHATARGADVLAWIVGWAQTNDAHHISNPSGEGLERCMRTAIDHAGLHPEEIVHVNAHATGTGAGDQQEAGAIGRVFGAHRPSVTAVKGRTGHAMSAAGAFEAASVVLSFRHRLLPPTATDLELDPAIDLDVVHRAPRPWSPGPVLSGSVGLGGQNACLVLVPPTD